MKRISEIENIMPLGLERALDRDISLSDRILELHREHGFKKFMLTGPSKKWRNLGFPPKQVFEDLAHAFKKVQSDVAPYGIECGWWISICMKSGPREDFTRIKRSAGTLSPFANCPLDEGFKSFYADCVATFAKIAKPSFIILEDDYSIVAASQGNGCFCDLHLKEFSRREGREFAREELSAMLYARTPDSIALLRRWRQLIKDSLVDFAKNIRATLDVDSPEIPVGLMQAGCADKEGDFTYDVCKALAGERHDPFCRFYGTFYNGVRPQDIPTVLFHPIYSLQHSPENLIAFHESDSYPTSRFFTSGAEMRAIMTSAYCAGFEGSTFQIKESSDIPEETAYTKMFARERVKFSALKQAVSKCEMRGVEICYDPFANTVDTVPEPYWTQCVGLFGIPYTSKESSIAFLDKRHARYFDDETLKRYLSKGLFIDGDAAKILYERGYGDLIGAEIGEYITDGPLSHDLGAKEVIRPEFRSKGKASELNFASVFASGGEAKAVRITPISDDCRVVTDAVGSKDGAVCPGMTIFKNSLGGTVVILGMCIANTYTQSLLSYVRQRLFGRLISEMTDDIAFVKDSPRVFTFMNLPKSRDADFIGIISHINLGCDTLDSISLALPKDFAGASEVLSLGLDGLWHSVPFERTEDGAKIDVSLPYLDGVHLMFK